MPKPQQVQVELLATGTNTKLFQPSISIKARASTFRPASNAENVSQESGSVDGPPEKMSMDTRAPAAQKAGKPSQGLSALTKKRGFQITSRQTSTRRQTAPTKPRSSVSPRGKDSSAGVENVSSSARLGRNAVRRATASPADAPDRSRNVSRIAERRSFGPGRGRDSARRSKPRGERSPGKQKSSKRRIVEGDSMSDEEEDILIKDDEWAGLSDLDKQELTFTLILVGDDEGLRKFLVQNRAYANRRNSSGETPLASAVRMGRLDVVTVLVWAGAQLHATDPSGMTAVELATQLGNEEVVIYLEGQIQRQKEAPPTPSPASSASASPLSSPSPSSSPSASPQGSPSSQSTSGSSDEELDEVDENVQLAELANKIDAEAPKVRYTLSNLIVEENDEDAEAHDIGDNHSADDESSSSSEEEDPQVVLEQAKIRAQQIEEENRKRAAEARQRESVEASIRRSRGVGVKKQGGPGAKMGGGKPTAIRGGKSKVALSKAQQRALEEEKAQEAATAANREKYGKDWEWFSETQQEKIQELNKEADDRPDRSIAGRGLRRVFEKLEKKKGILQSAIVTLLPEAQKPSFHADPSKFLDQRQISQMSRQGLVKLHHDQKAYSNDDDDEDSHEREVPFTKQGDLDFYTRAMLSQREQLKSDAGIQASIKNYWDTCKKTFTRPPPKISKETYTHLLLLMHDVLVPGVSLLQARKQILPDVAVDFRGHREGLEFDRFRDAIFQIADSWTLTTEATEYITFLDTVFRLITVKHEDGTSKFVEIPIAKRLANFRAVLYRKLMEARERLARKMIQEAKIARQEQYNRIREEQARRQLELDNESEEESVVVAKKKEEKKIEEPKPTPKKKKKRPEQQSYMRTIGRRRRGFGGGEPPSQYRQSIFGRTQLFGRDSIFTHVLSMPRTLRESESASPRGFAAEHAVFNSGGAKVLTARLTKEELLTDPYKLLKKGKITFAEYMQLKPDLISEPDPYKLKPMDHRFPFKGSGAVKEPKFVGGLSPNIAQTGFKPTNMELEAKMSLQRFIVEGPGFLFGLGRTPFNKHTSYPPIVHRKWVQKHIPHWLWDEIQPDLQDQMRKDLKMNALFYRFNSSDGSLRPIDFEKGREEALKHNPLSEGLVFYHSGRDLSEYRQQLQKKFKNLRYRHQMRVLLTQSSVHRNMVFNNSTAPELFPSISDYEPVLPPPSWDPSKLPGPIMLDTGDPRDTTKQENVSSENPDVDKTKIDPDSTKPKPPTDQTHTQPRNTPSVHPLKAKPLLPQSMLPMVNEDSSSDDTEASSSLPSSDDDVDDRMLSPIKSIVPPRSPSKRKPGAVSYPPFQSATPVSRIHNNRRGRGPVGPGSASFRTSTTASASDQYSTQVPASLEAENLYSAETPTPRTTYCFSPFPLSVRSHTFHLKASLASTPSAAPEDPLSIVPGSERSKSSDLNQHLPGEPEMVSNTTSESQEETNYRGFFGGLKSRSRTPRALRVYAGPVDPSQAKPSVMKLKTTREQDVETNRSKSPAPVLSLTPAGVPSPNLTGSLQYVKGKIGAHRYLHVKHGAGLANELGVGASLESFHTIYRGRSGEEIKRSPGKRRGPTRLVHQEKGLFHPSGHQTDQITAPIQEASARPKTAPMGTDTAAALGPSLLSHKLALPPALRKRNADKLQQRTTMGSRSATIVMPSIASLPEVSQSTTSSKAFSSEIPSEIRFLHEQLGAGGVMETAAQDPAYHLLFV